MAEDEAGTTQAGGAQPKTWILFLCTALLLVAAVVVIAGRLKPDEGPAAEDLAAKLAELEKQIDAAKGAWNDLERTQAERAALPSRVDALDQGLTSTQNEAQSARKEAAASRKDASDLLKQLARHMENQESHAGGLNDAELRAQVQALMDIVAEGKGTLDQRVAAVEKDVGVLLEHVPVGTILAWDPYPRNARGERQGEERRKLPEGWSVCNGMEGTPDLTDLFLRGTKVDSDTGVPENNDARYAILENGDRPAPDWKATFRLAGSVSGGKFFYGRPIVDLTPAHYKVMFIMKVRKMAAGG